MAGFPSMVQLGTGPLGAAAGNGLLNNLIAYWPADEASGNLIDAHTNGLDLTDVNTVTNNPGHVYATARQYTRVNAERHSRPGDDALLSMGDNDYMIATWIYLDSKPAGSFLFLTSKDNNINPNREFLLVYNTGADRFRWNVRDVAGANIAGGPCDADNLGSPSLSTWYLVLVWHDAGNDQVGIQVNNGIADTLATGGTAPADGAAAYMISGWASSALYTHDGRIGPTAVWKSAAGGGGVLTADQRTALWNGGAGLTYAELTT